MVRNNSRASADRLLKITTGLFGLALVATLARAAGRLTKPAPLVVISEPSSSRARKLGHRALTSKVPGVAVRYARNWSELGQFLPAKEFASLREGKPLAAVFATQALSWS